MALMEPRRVNTTDSMKGKSDAMPCQECGKRVRLLFRRPNARWTCADCTPQEDQFVSEIKE